MMRILNMFTMQLENLFNIILYVTMHFNELTNYLAPFYQIPLDIMMFDVQYVKLIFIII
jgi:hypothetical protein